MPARPWSPTGHWGSRASKPVPLHSPCRLRCLPGMQSTCVPRPSGCPAYSLQAGPWSCWFSAWGGHWKEWTLEGVLLGSLEKWPHPIRPRCMEACPWAPSGSLPVLPSQSSSRGGWNRAHHSETWMLLCTKGCLSRVSPLGASFPPSARTSPCTGGSWWFSSPSLFWTLGRGKLPRLSSTFPMRAWSWDSLCLWFPEPPTWLISACTPSTPPFLAFGFSSRRGRYPFDWSPGKSLRADVPAWSDLRQPTAQRTRA